MSEYNIQMNKYNALNAEYDQLYPQPMKHASTHAKDGSDPITPSMIGTYNKTEIDTALQNKAENDLSNVSDAVMKAKIESSGFSSGVKMVLLWENASPTSTFLNQTVQIDLTMYPIVAVEDADGNINYFANPTTSGTNLVTFVGGGNIAAKIYKRMCKVTATGVIFGSCLSVSALNQTTTTEDNGKCIPLNIYGITR